MNHYDTLGVHKNASQEEIKNAYKNLVKKYHPDIYKGDKTFAEKKTAQINVAYDVLSNPESRAVYDEEIAPKSTYTYTPPQYTSSYNPNKNRQTSYDTYKHKYRSTVSEENFRRDGSEHDYYTYVNYNSSNRYSDYNRSKTPNSNYTYKNNNSDDFSNKMYNKFSGLKNSTQKQVIFLIIIVYLIFLVYFFFQSVAMFDTKEKYNKDSYKEKSNYNQNITTNENYNYEDENLENNNIISNTIINDDNNINNSINNNVENITGGTQEINIYDLLTEQEIKDYYSDFTAKYGNSISYEQFKEILESYLSAYYSSY